MATAPTAGPTVKTRILILSDTHGQKPVTEEPNGSTSDASDTPAQGYRYPLPEADVAIHCGDLTSNSNVQEFEATFSMLRELSAPLKLVIAGNHDMALDRHHWDLRVKQIKARRALPALVAERYQRCPDEARRIIDAARRDGVIYLPNDGVYEFELRNGARLRVFASPMTPAYGSWAFQYPRGAHKFDIPAGIDVAVTHGPPRNVRDLSIHGGHAGCDDLFAAVCASKPKIHCFGHIHEGWGAELVTWKQSTPPAALSPDEAAKLRTRETAIDETATVLVESSEQINKLLAAGPDGEQAAEARVARFYKDKCIPVDITSAGNLPFRAGEQTLFVNAAIMDARYDPIHVPWLVDVDLPKAGPEASD